MAALLSLEVTGMQQPPSQITHSRISLSLSLTNTCLLPLVSILLVLEEDVLSGPIAGDCVDDSCACKPVMVRSAD